MLVRRKILLHDRRASLLSRDLLDIYRHRIVIRNKAIPCSLHIPSPRVSPRYRTRAFLRPTDSSARAVPHPPSFLSLFPRHILLHSRSTNLLQPVYVVGARHRRILAKSVPPILDASPLFFSYCRLFSNSTPAFSYFFSSSLDPNAFSLFLSFSYRELPPHRPRRELPFYFRESVCALFLVVLENPPLLFPGLGSAEKSIAYMHAVHFILIMQPRKISDPIYTSRW